jgi:integrase/recombinase XerD
MDDTIGSYLGYLSLERSLSPKTVRAYGGDLEQCDGWMEENLGHPLAEADPGDLAEYLADLARRGLSTTSVRRKLSSIRGYFRHLQECGRRADDPTSLLTPPRGGRYLPEALSLDEARRLVEAFDGSDSLSVRNRALLELAYGSGLRESELVELTVSRVYLEEAFVRPMGKGGRERLVPMGPQTVSWLDRYISGVRPTLLRSAGRASLFLTYRGNPMSRMAVWNVVRKAGRLAGVSRRLYPHILRHSFATHLLEGGADLRVVQELLGHADISTTEIYTSVGTAHLRRIVDSCHPRSAPC